MAAPLRFFSLRRISPAAAVPQLARARSLRDWLRHCSIAGRLFLLVTGLSALSPAFSERVISPVPGSFANRQALVLDLSDGAEAFYSYTDTNPLDSGFAYDSPVLIDASGDVCLRIAVVKGGGSGGRAPDEEYRIEYSVSGGGNPFGEGTREKSFIDRVTGEGILPCAGGASIIVPASLRLSVGDGEKPVSSGGTLRVAAGNSLSRYIPCTVTNGSETWRFIVFLSAGEAAPSPEADVPFEITGWETFRFTGRNLIWAVDNGMWSASQEAVRIDRARTHVIYWQDVAYKEGNPIQSFVLPPKPEIRTGRIDKAVTFDIDGDPRYRLSVVSNGASGDSHEDTGLRRNLTFDTFEGDYVSATAVFALYCDGVFQGELSEPYTIDRQPPLPPRFVASESGEYARHDVRLRVESEPGARIYLCLLGPFDVGGGSYLGGSSEFDYIKPEQGDYSLYDLRTLELRAGAERAVGYKAFAYAEDSGGNVSSVAAYKVIIDEYNYFLDGSAPDFAADGTRLHPYNSFEQVLSVINGGRFVHFFVSGSVALPEGVSVISSNCSFTGMADARFVIPPSGRILVRDASLEMRNCVIEKETAPGSRSDQLLLVAERAAVCFEDCEILGSFDSSGTAVSAEASLVSLRNSGLTVRGAVYACGISGVSSRVILSGSHFASISDTAVNFSMRGGSFELDSCGCRVISHLGRILESTGANLRLVSNTYTGEFDGGAKGAQAVWLDEKSLVLEDRNNITQGF